MEKWKLINIKKVKESDGTLYVMENNREIPFETKRIFLVANVMQGKNAGGPRDEKNAADPVPGFGLLPGRGGRRNVEGDV